MPQAIKPLLKLAEVNDVPIGQDVVVKVTVPEGGDGNVTEESTEQM